jgi:hypothetical protein
MAYIMCADLIYNGSKLCGHYTAMSQLISEEHKLQHSALRSGTIDSFANKCFQICRMLAKSIQRSKKFLGEIAA